MLQELEIAPEETLFVGDTWTCDVEGPLRGMQPVYIRRTHFGPNTLPPLDLRLTSYAPPRLNE